MKTKVSTITLFSVVSLTLFGGLSASAAPVKPNVESKTIYKQVMKDGSVVFSDAGQAGAVKTAEIRYRSTSGADAMKVAKLHSEHWNRQSDGFNQRQAQRDADYERARRERLQLQYIAQASQPDYGWYGPRIVYGAAPRLPSHLPLSSFPQQGVSGVGAAHNVPSSFIGSGFASAGASGAVTFGRR
jgi:hypothetical protein